MGCRPVAVVIMHVHEYEIRIRIQVFKILQKTSFWNFSPQHIILITTITCRLYNTSLCFCCRGHRDLLWKWREYLV